MNIIYDYPPNYKKIAAAFNIKGNEGVIFTYGNDLYIPGGQRIPLDKPLIRHEEVHSRQQKKMGIGAWWDRFLEDPAFRLSQELEAYREQYRAMAGLPLKTRIGYLDHISNDLSGEMYGNLLTKDEATQVITEGIILKNPASKKHKNIRKLKKLKRQNRKKGRK